MSIAAIRFNNPGDVSLPIRGWSGPGEIVGIEGQKGYAKFPSMEIGYAAFQQRVISYIEEGYTTIAKMGREYATDPAWGAKVAQMARLSEYMVLEPENKAEISALCQAIIRQETGKTIAQLEALSKEA
jgi:hypothetical protein